MIRLGLRGIIARHMGRRLMGRAEITEEQLAPILREIRVALLNSDVNLEVVRRFLAEVKEDLLVHRNFGDASGPDAAVFASVRRRLTEVLGERSRDLRSSPNRPTRVLVVGLNGSGKTTTTAKLAHMMRSRGPVKSVCLDVHRPGAYEQLEQLSRASDVPFAGARRPEELRGLIRDQLRDFEGGGGFIFFDCFGLLADNGELLEEVERIRRMVNPQEVLFVMDAMAGQDIIPALGTFHSRLGITGLVVSKADSDAPMGGALSAAHLLKIPIKYMGRGEGIRDLERFHPDRIASTILGEGDILTLAEKMEENLDVDSSRRIMARMMRGQFDLNDLLVQIGEMRKVGPLGNLFKMVPGTAAMRSRIDVGVADEQLRVWEVLIGSMTMKERRNPKLFRKQPGRRVRVIRGSGRRPDELNKLLKKWEEVKKKVEEVSSGLKRGKNPLKFFGL